VKKSELRQIIREEISTLKKSKRRKYYKRSRILKESLQDEFVDHLVQLSNLTPEESNTPAVVYVMMDVWDEMGFEEYEETGQGISSSDYAQALELLKSKL